MPVLELITSSGLGSLLGMRHALEPDHLAAVSTLVTGERNSVKAALLGVCWGLGHTFSLIVVGTILVILRAEMPARVADGVRAVRRADADRPRAARDLSRGAAGEPSGPSHVHHHGHTVHVHEATPAHIHIGTWDAGAPAAAGRCGAWPRRQRRADRAGGRDAAVDRRAHHLHGRVSDWGSTLGMAALVRIARLAARTRGTEPQPWSAVSSAAVGCVSTVLGLFWGYPLLGRVF